MGMDKKKSFRYILCFCDFQELNDIRQSGLKSFRDIQVDESNILTWQGLIVPVSISNMIIADHRSKCMHEHVCRLWSGCLIFICYSVPILQALPNLGLSNCVPQFIYITEKSSSIKHYMRIVRKRCCYTSCIKLSLSVLKWL